MRPLLNVILKGGFLAAFGMTVLGMSPVLANEAGAQHKFCEEFMKAREKHSAEYVPGVDASGKPVVPAENEPVITAAEVTAFPISVDMAKYLGIDLPQGTEMQAELAKMTLKGNTIYYNDQPLNQTVEERLYRICQDGNHQ